MGNRIALVKYTKFSLFIVAGFIIGLVYSSMSAKSNRIPLGESLFIFKELASLGDIEITKNSCEIFDKNNKLIEKKLKVSDFIASYLNISMYYRTKKSYEDLECGARGENICSFSFGKRKKHEGWGRHLWFKYDMKKKSIAIESFGCVDIP